MKSCPLCKGVLLKSTLKNVYACVECSNIFEINMVRFEAPGEQLNKKRTKATPAKEVGDYKETESVEGSVSE